MQSFFDNKSEAHHFPLGDLQYTAWPYMQLNKALN